MKTLVTEIPAPETETGSRSKNQTAAKSWRNAQKEMLMSKKFINGCLDFFIFIHLIAFIVGLVVGYIYKNL